MKRILSVFLFLFILSSCSASKIITVPNTEYSCLVSISFEAQKYMYKLDKGDDYRFTACADTIPIDFCVSGNKVTTSYNKASADYVDALNYSHIAIISEIIKSSINAQVSPDYNGNYIIHGNCRNTEYALQLNESGFPLKITSKNSNLIADFTNIKEVNNGN